jgi:hypothetical protein
MADIASTDVTYALLKKIKGDSGYVQNQLTAVFGDGALTYPSGGIPLDKNKMGVPNQVINLKIYDQGSANGLVYKYDAANNKIRIYRSGGFTPAGTVATHTHTIPAGTDGAGGTSGTTAPAFTGTAAVAASLVELVAATTAPAAATLYIEVMGW